MNMKQMTFDQYNKLKHADFKNNHNPGDVFRYEIKDDFGAIVTIKNNGGLSIEKVKLHN